MWSPCILYVINMGAIDNRLGLQIHNVPQSTVHPVASSGMNPNVYLHIEGLYPKYHIWHVGISFRTRHKSLRYDFRAFNNQKTYITTGFLRNDLQFMFPDLHIPEKYVHSSNVFERSSQTIFWGKSSRKLKDIFQYERDILSKKPYIIGLYDCRHYVSDFSKFALDKPTPIWTLHTTVGDIS
jgi:hypothetical protein